jgi:UTP--glucose-1-phosphate uridylyltransferase
MKKLKKAVIPAAGLGTRFLPATKSIPKEMLTVVDAPIIFYVIEEAIAAGIQDIVLIQGRGKTAIEDFFDTSYELEHKLAQDNKYHLMERVERVRSRVNIISIRQKQALGLGHAVLCARPIVGDEPFAVLLGDEIMVPQSPQENYTLCDLKASFERLQASTVAVMPVTQNDVSKYGIADVDETQSSPWQVRRFVEKPSPQESPSRWALPGRYVFSPEIFEILENTPPGRGGEIQLTDAMNELAQRKEFFAQPITNKRYDAGDKLGYLMANIELGLKHPQLGEELRAYLKELARNAL